MKTLTGILCGRGGQGIVTLNHLLGSLAARLGHRVISAETHGMAMRGGSVATFLKIGPFESPSIALGSADFVLSTDAGEALRNGPFLAPGGLCLVDDTAPVALPPQYASRSIDAASLAAERFGNPVLAGQILLGRLFAAFPALFPPEQLLPLLSGDRKINADAIRVGLETKD